MTAAGGAPCGDHRKKNRGENLRKIARCPAAYSDGKYGGMLIGYAQVSKADGSQLLDLQRDALVDAGVAEGRTYEDLPSGRKDHRPGLDACLKALQPGNTFIV